MMGTGNRAVLYAACLMAALLLAACNDDKVCPGCNEGAGRPCPPKLALAASASDGEVTLTWEHAVGLRTTVKAWRIRHAAQGEGWSDTGSTGPAATAYVVSGLKNDVAYTFQVRAQLDAADFGCWSAPTSVVPRRIDDVMKEIEKHQRAIAKRMADLVEGMEARQELLEELGKRGITTLGNVATSTRATAEHTAATRDRVVDVVSGLDLTREQVVAATNAVEKQTERVGDKVGEVKASVDAARQEVVSKLSEISGKLDNACDGCEGLPTNCHLLGNVFFEHGIHTIEDRHREGFDEVLGQLQDQDAGFVLTEGYASSVGHVVYNLRLSDQRTACVSRCLDHGTGPGRFAFMEIARGEVLDVSDPAGTRKESDQHRRVKVAFCRDYPIPAPSAVEREPVWPDREDCGCTNLDSDVSA